MNPTTPIDLVALGRDAIDLLEYLSDQKQEQIPLRSLPAQWRTHDLLFVLCEEWLVRLTRRQVGHFWSGGQVLGSTESWGGFRKRPSQTLQEALDEDAQDELKDCIHIRLTMQGRSELMRYRHRTAVAQKAGDGQALSHGSDSRPKKLIKLVDASLVYDASPSTLHRAVRDGDLIDYRPKNARQNAEVLLDEDAVARMWSKK